MQDIITKTAHEYELRNIQYGYLSVAIYVVQNPRICETPSGLVGRLTIKKRILYTNILHIIYISKFYIVK